MANSGREGRAPLRRRRNAARPLRGGQSPFHTLRGSVALSENGPAGTVPISQSGRPIPDGELVRRGHRSRPRGAWRESSPSHLHERRRLGSQSEGQGVLRRKHIKLWLFFSRNPREHWLKPLFSKMKWQSRDAQTNSFAEVSIYSSGLVSSTRICYN